MKLTDRTEINSVCNLNISTRLKNNLKRMGVNYVSEISKYSYEDYEKCKNMGERTMYELNILCEKEGIHITHLSEIKENIYGIISNQRQLNVLFANNMLHPEKLAKATEKEINELILLISTHGRDSFKKKIDKVIMKYKSLA